MRTRRQRGSNVRCTIIPPMYHYSLGGSAPRRTPAGEGVAAMPEDERRPLSKVMPALLRRGGLQDLAAAALERTLAADPDDADALWKLAEVHRRQGDFAAARGLYGRLRTRGPDRRKAAWLHAVLNGDGAPEGAPGGVFWPAPFVWMTDFLAPEECDRLLALGVERREGLTPVKKGGVSSVARKDSKDYLGWEMDAGTTREVMLWFVPRIRSVLPDVLVRLGMAGLDRCRIEMGMRVCFTGGFLSVHSDTAGGGYRRKLAFVYFFHRRPRRFSGGDLLLHDTDVEAGAGHIGAFSRITPLRNSIVFFPSTCFHQVTLLQRGADDFEDGRWVLNGHVWRVDEDSAPERLPF